MAASTKAVKVNDLTAPDEKQPESTLRHGVGEYTGRRYTMSFRAGEIKAAGLSG